MMLLLLRKKISIPLPFHCSNCRGFVMVSTSATTQNPDSKTPFIVDYLINSCGLAADQALKASKSLAHIKSPSKPDSVLHFLRKNGFSDAHIRTLICKLPRVLCAKAEKTLERKVNTLREVGFSGSEIPKLVVVIPQALTCSDLRPKMEFWRSLIGPDEDLLKFFRRDLFVINYSIEKTIKPNVSLLRQYGISDRQISRMALHCPRFISNPPNKMNALLERASELGIPPDSKMFAYALQTVASISRKTANAKLKLLKSLGWSEVETSAAIKKFPSLLNLSEKKIRDIMAFLVEKVGLDISSIANCPVLLAFSLKKRLVPRHYVFQVLKLEGLPLGGVSPEVLFFMTEVKFLEKFILAHNEKVPWLHEAYSAASLGKIPN